MQVHWTESNEQVVQSPSALFWTDWCNLLNGVRPAAENPPWSTGYHASWGPRAACATVVVTLT